MGYMMKKLIVSTLLSLVLFSVSKFAFAEKALVLGIFPYVSPAKLIKHHQSLVQHFEQGLKRKVSIVTAKNVTDYVDQVKKNKYDIIYAAPHLARYAEKKWGYQRVSMTTHNIQAFIVVPKESSYKTLADLKGKKITVVPPLAIFHQMLINDLKQFGMQKGRDYSLNITRTNDNAIFSVVNGESDAAVTGIKLWRNLEPEYKNKLRRLAKSIKTTGFIIMAKPGLSQETIFDLKRLSLNFNDTLKGKKYLFHGLKIIDNKSMKSLDAYTSVFK